MLVYSLAYLIPLSAALGLGLGGLFAWSTVALVYVVIPLIDQWWGPDSRNLDDAGLRRVRESRLETVMLAAAVPVQWALVIGFLGVWQSEATLLERAGWIVSVGLSCGGLGITVAHELVHRRSRLLYGAGQSLLLSVLYMHFAIEHVRGHHQRVGTDEDPASARAGESVYGFALRSFLRQYPSAWQLESARLAKLGRPVFSLYNEMLWIGVVQTSWLLLVVYFFGWGAMLAYLGVAFTAVMLLEVVNYVEHYGLRRRVDEKGRVEPVRAHHSWNSDHRFGRIFLFELPRHTDHHMNAGRPFGSLMSVPGAPQLPAGYPTMVLLALLPPLWSRVMDPRVEALQAAR